MTTARVIFPHQLFVEHLDADPGTLMVLVEPDLFFRQLPFHTHKLVLHRATLRAFEERLRARGLSTVYVETSADGSTHDRLVDALHGVTSVTVYDVVDDWLERDLRKV